MSPPQASVTRIDRRRAAVTALFFANGFGFGAWVAHLPLFKTRLGLSDGVLGSALFCASLASLVAMPLLGTLIARYGSRGAATGASIAASVLLVLPFLAASLLEFVFAAIAIGAAYSAMDVAMNAQAVALEARRARAIMSSFHAFFSTGGLVGSVASALLIARGLSIEADGAIVALTACAFVAVALPFLTGEAEVAQAAQSRRAQLNALRPVALFGALAFLGLVGEGAMSDWSGIYLRSSLAVAAAASAAGFGAFSIAMAVGRGLGDAIVARAGAARTLVAGSLLATAALAGALLVHTAWAAYLGFVLVGLGLANVIPILFSAAGRVRSLPPGVGIASVSTLGYAGFLVGPPAIGFTSDAFGLRIALTLVVVCIAAIAMLAPKALAHRAQI